MTATARDDILHHWQQVHARSGQPFQFDNALPDDFIYDTNPPARRGDGGRTRPVENIRDVQSDPDAFYAEGRDVTQPPCWPNWLPDSASTHLHS